jgi:hypothetical protein
MEIWKDIPGYEGQYQASDIGRIKSIGNDKTRKEKILKLTNHKSGYLAVNLSKNGIDKKLKVHRLILMAFVGQCPTGYECLHLDDNRKNNNIKNLRWGTSSENNKMRYNHGRVKYKGKDGPNAKLTQAQVDQIRFMKGKVKWGYWAKLARAIDVGKTAISDIVNNKSWINS